MLQSKRRSEILKSVNYGYVIESFTNNNVIVYEQSNI